MTANLPVGFVTNSGSIIGDIERIDNVPVEDISKLWKGEQGLRLLAACFALPALSRAGLMADGNPTYSIYDEQGYLPE